jgi:hypothetical protein
MSNTNIKRYIISILLAILTFITLQKLICICTFKKEEILDNLISTNSVIIAIIITFLFSKLFAEKTIRIERKKEIDELALKVTYMRRIAFHIRGLHEFWKFDNINIKSIIDNKYNKLTYEEYRGYGKFKNKTYEEFKKIDQDIYGTDGQAYLSLKELEDGENLFNFFSEFNPKNYSLNDIERFREYSGSFLYLLENSDDSIVNFNNVSSYKKTFIEELYLKIMKTSINKSDYKGSLKNLFSHFESEIFDKIQYLISLNSNPFPKILINSFLNLLVFLVLLISSLFILIINLNYYYSFVLSIGVISIFIANTIDLIILTYYSIKDELNINEIYKL